MKEYDHNQGNSQSAGHEYDHCVQCHTRKDQGSFSGHDRARLEDADVNIRDRVVTKAKVNYPISAPVIDVNGVTVKKSEYTVKYYVDGAPVTKNTKGYFDSENPVTVTAVISAKTNKNGIETGNYTGSAEGTYKITLADGSKDLAKAKVIIQKKGDSTHKAVTKFNFTGNAIEFGCGEYDDYELYVYVGKNLKDTKKKELEENVHFTANYSNNVKTGKATIVINAVEGSNYYGSRSVKFSIVKGVLPWLK